MSITFQISDQGQMIAPSNFCDFLGELRGVHAVTLQQVKTYSPEDNSVSVFFDAQQFFSMTDGSFILSSAMQQFLAVQLEYQTRTYKLDFVSSKFYNTPDGSFHRVEMAFTGERD